MVASVDVRINKLLEITQFEGYAILTITTLLAIIQGFLGFFPFATLIVIHISALGLGTGLFASWLIGTIACTIVYMVCRYFFFDWFFRKWGHKLQRYRKWQHYMDRYGFWVIVFLRTVPVMPNNLISFMAAVSPIKFLPYLGSSIVGNLSSIWLYGILSSSLVMPEIDIKWLTYTYIFFCLLLVCIFMATHFRGFRKNN